MKLEEAVGWLESHVNLEAIDAGRAQIPTLERMRELVELMGDPQLAYPVVHITGTNGKGSTARILTSLLMALGMSVGTYTSPNLERLNERLAWGGVPIADDDLAEQLAAVEATEGLMSKRPLRFEILTAAAFRWFADVAVDVAVVEVGLGGRWDATNVADADVAVVTNVSHDHVEVLGPTLVDIAREKAGIVKDGSTLVLGETDEKPAAVFKQAPAGRILERDADFGWMANTMAHGGRLLELFTPGASYPDVFLPLHGAHQGDNAACAVAAAEAFLGRPLSYEVVAEGLATARVPGRMEVVGRKPLCVLDGAHNPAGAAAAGATLAEEFAAGGPMIVVMGLLRGRDPLEMLRPLDLARIRSLIACPPPSPRAMAPGEVAAAARSLGLEAEEAPDAATAVQTALERSGEDEMVLVTGSLYVVGEARAALGVPVG